MHHGASVASWESIVENVHRRATLSTKKRTQNVFQPFSAIQQHYADWKREKSPNLIKWKFFCSFPPGRRGVGAAFLLTRSDTNFCKICNFSLLSLCAFRWCAFIGFNKKGLFRKIYIRRAVARRFFMLLLEWGTFCISPTSSTNWTVAKCPGLL